MYSKQFKLFQNLARKLSLFMSIHNWNTVNFDGLLYENISVTAKIPQLGYACITKTIP